MYGEIFSYNIKVDESSKQEAAAAFKVISQGKESFDYEMFDQARREKPYLLEWIDQPEKMMQREDKKPAVVDFKVFQNYHREVLKTIASLEDDLSQQLGYIKPQAQLMK